jgi:hypothetical protein
VAAEPRAGTSESNWLWGGILTGLFIPPVGFIVAIIVFAKGRVGHGLAILLTCFVGVTAGAALVCGAAVDDLESDLAEVADAPAKPTVKDGWLRDPLILANDAGRLRVTVTRFEDPLKDIGEYDEPMAGPGHHFVAATVRITNVSGDVFGGYLEHRLRLESGRAGLDDQPFSGSCSAPLPLDDLSILPGDTTIVCVPYSIKNGAIPDELVLTLPSDDVLGRGADATGAWFLL